MARVKNITEDVLEVPSLGLFGVQPGDIVEVPRASDFEDAEGWQVTATGTAARRKAARQRHADDEPATAEVDDTTTDEEPSL